MINVSKEFKSALLDKRKLCAYADITLAGGAEIHLDSKKDHIMTGGLRVEDAVSSDDSFDIGAAIINKCTVRVNNIDDSFSAYDFTDAEVVAYVGMELAGGRIEKIRKGTYAVDEAKYNGGTITLSCLDNMRKFDKPYSLSSLIYPATLGEIVRDACGVCGVPLQTQAFPRHDFVIQERPPDEATTFREIISWAAQIACCFCRCDVYGRLELKWYDTQALERAALDGGSFKPWTAGDTIDGGTFKPWTGGTVYDGGTFGDRAGIHHIYSNFSVDIATDDVVITGVRVLEKTKEDDKDEIVTHQAGTDGYVLSIENNALIQGGAGQAVAGWLGEQLIGLRFRPAGVSHLSDPTIEGGDVGFLTDRKGCTYRIVVSNTRFTAGDSQNTSCNAKTPARNSAVRYSAQTKAYVENRKGMEQEISSYDKTVQEMTRLISQGFGMYFTPVPQEDGGNKWFMHDKPTVEESSYVAQMTSNGIMASLDGGTTWALDKNGNALANVLTARGIRAEWINAGIFRVGDVGEEVFYANFSTKKVRIVADEFRLSSGKTIQAIAKDVSEEKLKTYDEALGQQEVFDRLTKNGADQCIAIDPDTGRLYINGEFIRARGLQVFNDDNVQTLGIDQKGDVSLNLSRLSVMGSEVASVDYVNSRMAETGENLLKDAFGLGSAYWTIQGATVTKNQADPMGGNRATKLTSLGGLISVSSKAGNGPFNSSSQSYRFSVWLKADSECQATIEACLDRKTVTAVNEWKMHSVIVSPGEEMGMYNGVSVAASAGAGNAVYIYNPSAVYSYTAEETLNLLTNNGNIKGIFMQDGELYVSASAVRTGTMSADLIKGGTLQLGGINHKNGQIFVSDENGELISYLNQNGLYAVKGIISGFEINQFALRKKNAAGQYVVMRAGTNERDIAFAAGGKKETYDDSPFYVLMNGQLVASDAYITGVLNTGDQDGVHLVVSGKLISAKSFSGDDTTAQINFPPNNESSQPGRGSVEMYAPNGFYVNGKQLA